MWVLFSRNWTWIPHGQRRRPEIAFKPGTRVRVTSACAAAALEAGAAVESSNPRFDNEEGGAGGDEGAA